MASEREDLVAVRKEGGSFDVDMVVDLGDRSALFRLVILFLNGFGLLIPGGMIEFIWLNIFLFVLCIVFRVHNMC